MQALLGILHLLFWGYHPGSAIMSRAAEVVALHRHSNFVRYIEWICWGYHPGSVIITNAAVPCKSLHCKPSTRLSHVIRPMRWLRNSQLMTRFDYCTQCILIYACMFVLKVLSRSIPPGCLAVMERTAIKRGKGGAG
jgi:hypothetical protein